VNDRFSFYPKLMCYIRTYIEGGRVSELSCLIYNSILSPVGSVTIVIGLIRETT